MAVFNEPTKWAQTLGKYADVTNIPDTAGETDPSIDKIFPSVFSIPLARGGRAIPRSVLNGLFKLLGDWIFFAQNGGLPTYSESFDYIAGRVVLYNGNLYKCIQANGVSSTVVAPDSNTAYWQRIDNSVRSVNGVNADANGNVTLPLNYLPLSGGTLTGGNINLNSNNSLISINGGTSYSTGAVVEIYGKDFSDYNLNGGISLITVGSDGNSKYRLNLYSNGTLAWNEENIVRSVNGVNADANGNVTLPLNYLPLSGGTLTGGAINLNSNNSLISINGGTSYSTGAVVEIYGKDFSDYNLNGGISLITVGSDGNSKYRLNLYSNGSLQWGGREVNPVGEVCFFACSSAPSGYLVCNGANVSRTTYADLFNAIGTTFGSGDGSTTFTLPNLIDRFAQGSTTVGTVKSAGLPNITGTADFLGVEACNGTNAMKGSHSSLNPTWNYGHRENYSGNNTGDIEFDAHGSNPIYGSSTTVQPPALTLLPCIRY